MRQGVRPARVRRLHAHVRWSRQGCACRCPKVAATHSNVRGRPRHQISATCATSPSREQVPSHDGFLSSATRPGPRQRLFSQPSASEPGTLRRNNPPLPRNNSRQLGRGHRVSSPTRLARVSGERDGSKMRRLCATPLLMTAMLEIPHSDGYVSATDSASFDSSRVLACDAHVTHSARLMRCSCLGDVLSHFARSVI